MNKRKLSALVAAAVVLASASPVAAATQTSLPKTSDVTINNYANKADTILVTGLNHGDTIKVYRDNFSSTVIGKATVSTGNTFTTVSVPQLGVNGGTIYLSVTNPGKSESLRIPKTYDAEPESVSPIDNEITIINGAKAGIVKVENLESGDIVKVYKDYNRTRVLGTATVVSGSTDVSVNTSTLDPAGGNIYITVTSPGKKESAVTTKHYDKVASSSAPLANEITIVNNGSMADTVTVENLEPGDTVNVYREKSSTRVLGTATVATGQTSASVTITQLGQASGKLYVSVVSQGRTESERVEKAYEAESKTAAPTANEIFVTNNKKVSDTILVENLQPGDLVKVYRDLTSTKPIASATVAADKADVSLNVGQLNVSPAVVYVTVTSLGKQESDKTKKDYSTEVSTDKLSELDVTVTNNPVISDTVVVENLQPGDTVKVYKEGNPRVLGSAIVAAGKTNVTVNIPQLGQEEGKIQVTVTSAGCAESEPVTIKYDAETVTRTPESDNIIVTNNAFPGDTVKITNLEEGSIVKVYRFGSTKVLGTATVPVGSNEATITIGQLGQETGSIDVTVINPGMAESKRLTVGYKEEQIGKAGQLSQEFITVTNNAIIADTVVVDNLKSGDVIKVYDTESKSKMLGTATVSVEKNSATVSIPQLGALTGKVYITVTSIGTTESDVIEKEYSAETVTDKLTADEITISNNTGTADTVSVDNLSAGDTVKVYQGVRTQLASKTVSEGETYAVVAVDELNEIKTPMYVTLARGLIQSRLMDIKYEKTADSIIVSNTGSENITVEIFKYAETVKTLLASQKAIDNISTISIEKLSQLEGTIIVEVNGTKANSDTYSISGDSITISGVVKDAIIDVYIDKPAKEKELVLEPGRTDEVIDIRQLGDISVSLIKKDSNYIETARISYRRDGNKIIINNLIKDDVLNIYTDQKGSKILGTAIVSTGKSNAAVNIAQLGQDEGRVFVTTTSKGMAESEATDKRFTAEGKTDKPSIYDITVSNNVGTADTIKVEGLESGDTVKVYSSATGGKVLGTAKVASTKGSSQTKTSATSTSTSEQNEATVTIAQLGQNQGKVYVSVTGLGKIESEPVEISFDAEPKSDKIDVSDIAVENNKLTADVVRVQNLSAGEIVKVYRNESKSKLLGTATVASGKTEAAVNIAQLGNNVPIFVTVTTPGKVESDLVQINSGSEDITGAPLKSDITTVNNAGIADIVKVINLEAGDIVNVYREFATRPIGTATVESGKTEAVINIDQLGTEKGKVLVAITSPGKNESSKAEVEFAAEGTTAKLSEDNIAITNNIIISDEIKVDNLLEGDIVKVYASNEAKDSIASATVLSGENSVIIKIDQLEGTSVYVTVTNQGKTESDRVKKDFLEETETVTKAISSEDITIINNGIIADTVSVQNVAPGDTVKIYKDDQCSVLLGTSIVAAGKTDTTMSIAQLGSDKGTIYVKVQSPGKTESAATPKAFDAEAITEAPLANDITLINNSSAADTVKIENLTPGDVIRIYDNKDKTGKVLGFGVVVTGKTSITINIPQIGKSSGKIYIASTTLGKAESTATEIEFVGESETVAPLPDEITVTNNSSAADTVKVDNVALGDVIKVFDQDMKKVLGSVKVAAVKTSATVIIPQLGLTGGTINVTLTSAGKLESKPTPITFASEGYTDSPSPDDIFITNNGVIADKVRVVNLSAGDIVKVFDASGTKVLGTATVAPGKTEATVNVTQLGIGDGMVKVAVKSPSKLESSKTDKNFIGEVSSEKLSENAIIITNNANGNDTVKVINLTAGDIIKVYREEKNTRAIGSAVVAQGKTEATVGIGQLGIKGGTIWISVTKSGRLESERISKTFLPEDQSIKLDSSQIIILGK